MRKLKLWVACAMAAAMLALTACGKEDKLVLVTTEAAASQSDATTTEDILADIKVGLAKTDGKYVEIPDRREAIEYSLSHAEDGDIIASIGKGHEDYQEIKGKKYPMDERVLIADILAGK